ncbi:DUF5723 family protein [Aquimarina pacifica]|uniref:DUF5723 family protein n=1 Tax=Aquimarina pacifica TaxID=1296415 RepID=UPI00046E6586|nr:DUF5723 family protein [Aquimarina pacifica]
MRGFIILFIGFWGSLVAQNKETLYDFTDLPQSLLLNPGAEVDFKFHMGIPALSQFHLNVGVKGVSLYDVFADNEVDINTKIETTLNDLRSDDYITATQQLELLTFGWKSKNNEKYYFSGGIYQELDMIGYFPKDFAVLAYQGNQEFINIPFHFSDIRASAELLMVYHFGYNKRVNKNLIFGARAKLYSSIFHGRTSNNQGFFTTVETPDGNNIYQHIVSGADLNLRTSGYKTIKDIVDGDSTEKAKEIKDELINRALLGGNLGFGVDAGFTHKVNDQLGITGSVNDLGLIVYSKDVETYHIRGDYTFEGFETPIQFTGNEAQDFLDEVEDAFEIDTLSNTYVVMRPVKFYGSVKYSFNQYKTDSCDCYLQGEVPPYMDAFGVQLFSQFRPRRTQYAASLFYYKRITNFLRTKLTYTVDDYSYYNVGFLLSTHIKKINFYISANNLIEYANLAKARGAAVQLGFNFIM